MEQMASIWDYQETTDELKQRLFYTTLELESVRLQANQEMTKNKENVNQLLQHLNTIYKERDEARDQIQKLLNKFASFYPQSQTINSPILTESNSLSDKYNYQSPNDPFFDIASSPDSSNLGTIKPPFVVDKGCLIIDKLAKGKILPEKGKLLQSVLEAGPLLKTLLLAGPLPMWQNPLPIQVFQVPRVSMNFDNRSCFGGVEGNNNGLLVKRQRLL